MPQKMMTFYKTIIYEREVLGLCGWKLIHINEDYQLCIIKPLIGHYFLKNIYKVHQGEYHFEL